MRLTGLLFATAAALSMLAAPAFADPANPAADLSLTNTGSDNGSGSLVNNAGLNDDVRAGATTKRSSKFAVTAPMVFLGLAVTAGVVAGAVAVSNSDSNPASA